MIPVTGLMLLPYPEEFAYHYIEQDCYNHGSWIYDRIKNNPQPVDIAFIGSSHTLHAVQEKKMEELVGNNLHFANLGYCRYGRNLEYVFLKLLLKYKSPRLVVIEVHEDEEKKGHPIFPYLAGTNDVLFPPAIYNRNYIPDLIQATSARLEGFKSSYIFKKAYPDYNPEPYGYAASDRKAGISEFSDNKLTWQERLNHQNPNWLEELQLKHPYAYLKKMTQLLDARNIPYVFLYLPDSGSGLEAPRFLNEYSKLGSIMIPPKRIFETSKNWMDASHLNDWGSEELTIWLTGQLKSNYCLDSFKPN